jgi:hypothetical protein
MQLRFQFLGAGKGNLVFGRQATSLTRRANCQPAPRQIPRLAALRPSQPTWLTFSRMLIPIAFLYVSIDRDFMGQQHRVRGKRKRRLAYLQRKKAAARTAATRSSLSKQPAQKEATSAE